MVESARLSKIFSIEGSISFGSIHSGYFLSTNCVSSYKFSSIFASGYDWLLLAEMDMFKETFCL